MLHSSNNLGVIFNNLSDFPHEDPSSCRLLFLAEVGLISGLSTLSILVSPAAFWVQLELWGIVFLFFDLRCCHEIFEM